MGYDLTIARVLSFLLALPLGGGISASTERPFPTPPSVIVASESGTTAGPAQRMVGHSSLASSLASPDEFASLIPGAIRQTEIAARIAQLANQTPAQQRYMMEASIAAMTLHSSNRNASAIRQYGALLVSAQQQLLATAGSYAEWLAISRAIDPDSDAYDVPDRFIEAVDDTGRGWTAEDSEVLSAVSDFVRSRG